MNAPKKHHFVPQFYLAGFTDDGTKDGRLRVFDRVAGVTRQGTPRTEGYRKHFYRVEIAGEDPQVVEHAFGRVEAEVAPVVAQAIASSCLPTGSNLDALIFFIALQALRGPSIRDSRKRFDNDVARSVLELISSDEELFQVSKDRMTEHSGEAALDVTRGELAEYVEQTTFSLDQTSQIGDTLQALPLVGWLLEQRHWSLVIAKDMVPDFVTSDAPVSVMPRGALPPWGTVGFGMANTVVTFPLSRRIALLGTFEPVGGSARISGADVAAINGLTARGSQRFIWSRRPKFPYMIGHDIRTDPAFWAVNRK